MTCLLLIAFALLGIGAAWAQPLQVYSEFRRIDPFGQIVPPDRGARPREILSPSAARNAYLSFHVVVTPAAGQRFTLDIAQNPADAVQVTLYRELHARHGDAWIPDRLESVSLPYKGAPLEDTNGMSGQTAVSFWLDLWVDRDAPVRRVRVEAQLNLGEEWLIYPMEIRVGDAKVPAHGGFAAPLPAVTEPAEAGVLGPLRSYLCGNAASGEAKDGGPLTVRRMIRRNAVQDVALARSLEARLGADVVADGLLGPLGISGRQSWCAAPPLRSTGRPEWFLRARDFLHRSAID